MWQALFLSGKANQEKFLKSLALACDYIWTADGGLEHALDLKLKPNYHVGDDDSLGERGLRYLAEEKIPHLKFPEKKDEPDSALAIHLMLAKQEEDRFNTNAVPPLNSQRKNIFPTQSGIVLLAALGDRHDHVLANLDLAERYARPDLPFLLTDGNSLIWILKGPFSMQVPECAIPGEGKAYFSLLALSDEVRGINLSGALWPLENRQLFHGINLGLSNEFAADDKIYLSFASGTLRFILSREDKENARLGRKYEKN